MTESSLDRLPEAIECLLFAATEPLTLERLAKVLERDEAEVYRAMVELRLRYTSGRGMQIRQVAGGFQLVTHPDFGEIVTRLLSAPPGRLSRAALETLSIIAYQQPITLPEIESIRGVNASGVVKTLVDRGLVREAGKKESAGRPMLYATTDEFLMYFGLKDLSQLPDLDTFAATLSEELSNPSGTPSQEGEEAPASDDDRQETSEAA
ncbi:MAG: SMC-Scp complex subunit ScpB [Armatimonadetes bacterium]|nr:SMC-Scp complex subunit ScpB [Armatimonadota bacterium]